MLFLFYIDKVKKSYIYDKLPVFKYLPSIISYNINVRHPKSESFLIREYYEICMTVSLIAWHLYKHVKNVFNICASVSIETKLYMWKICAYGIEYLSGACLIACIGCSLVVCYLVSPNTLLGLLSCLWVWQPSEPLFLSL